MTKIGRGYRGCPVPAGQQIAAEFEPMVDAVVPVPFDPALKDGAKVDFTQLALATRRAY